VGRHAQYYDTIYAEKPYAKEAAYVAACIKRNEKINSNNLLELACGTGRHALELEKLGYKILATDYSRDLLAVAKEKARASGSSVEFKFRDMRNLELSKSDFDCVYCLFDSIGYVQTNEALLEVFKGAHSHLRSGGLFVVEFWHAAAMLRKYEPRRERQWQMGNSLLSRISSTKLDVEKQLAHVTYEFKEDQKDGTHFSLEETQTNRYFLVQEFGMFLTEAGFEPLEWLPAYEAGPITEDTWHILSISRRT
jgi:SAM-dependent methyltransferase